VLIIVGGLSLGRGCGFGWKFECSLTRKPSIDLRESSREKGVPDVGAHGKNVIGLTNGFEGTSGDAAGKSEEDPAAEGMFLHDNIPKLFRMRIAASRMAVPPCSRASGKASRIAIAGKRCRQVSEYSAHASKNGLSPNRRDSPK